MISLSLFHILAKMLLFLPCYRTNRSVTCGSQSLKLISHDFDNSIAFLTDTTPFPSWDGRMSSWDSSFPLILSVRLPSSVLLHLPKCQALPTCTLWKFLTPSLVHLEEGRWDSVVLNLSLAHVLRLERRTSYFIWTEKLQTDVLFSHLATGRYIAVFGYLPTLFCTYRWGKGLIPLLCWCFYLHGGGHVLGRC